MSLASTGQKLREEFEKFYRNYYRQEIADYVQQRTPDDRSFVIDWQELHQFKPDVAEDFLNKPEEVRQPAEEALRTAIKDLPAEYEVEPFGPLHVRVANIGRSRTRGTDECRSRHIGDYFAVEGQVSKVSQISPQLDEAVFECQRCGTENVMPQTTDDQIQEPHECPGCERQGPYNLKPDESEWIDSQLVRIAQPPEETLGGRGAQLDIYLEDDGVIPLSNGTFKPGNRVTVTGRYTVRHETDGTSQYFDGDVVQVEESDYEEINISDDEVAEIEAIADREYGDPFDLVTQSVAPTHHGDTHIKQALGLQMFRGVRAQLPNGSWTRGDSHLLLLGDPGVGKSSLIRRVADLAPRSAYASGKGASAAGMTAAAVPSDFGDEKWDVQAGVLVLSTGGIACVDEIDKVQEDAVSSMHDALEAPQVVEVDKADIHTTLPAQTSLLAAGNPEYGRFDPHKEIADQITIDPTLLSRFDLMFLMQDEPDEDQDRELAESMIDARQAAVDYDHHGADAEETEVAPPIPDELLRKYVAYARQNYYPAVRSEEVREYLVSFFIELRSQGYNPDSPIPVTPRKLEGMQRLVEASARIRLSHTVEKQDVENVASLIIKSMNELGVNDDGQFDADVIETGTSKSQRDRVDALLAVVRELDDGDGANVDDVVEKMEADGFEEKSVRHAIAKLKAKRDLYEQDGVLRQT